MGNSTSYLSSLSSSVEFKVALDKAFYNTGDMMSGYVQGEILVDDIDGVPDVCISRTRTRTNTNPNDTEAGAAGRSGNARALRKQSKCGVYHRAPIDLPPGHERPWQGRNTFLVRRVAVNREVPLKIQTATC